MCACAINECNYPKTARLVGRAKLVGGAKLVGSGFFEITPTFEG